jgi:hypothetical protein
VGEISIIRAVDKQELKVVGGTKSHPCYSLPLQAPVLPPPPPAHHHHLSYPYRTLQTLRHHQKPQSTQVHHQRTKVLFEQEQSQGIDLVTRRI